MTTAEDWRGRVGRTWAEEDAALADLLGPFGTMALDRLGPRPGERVLDLGCGSGRTAVALADRGAIVTGIDLSPDLLALARARDPAGRVRWLEADAATARLPGPFDAFFSCCGTMFFDDPAAAFANLRSAMVPGGRAAAFAWAAADRNAWARVPLAAAEPILGTVVRAGFGTGPGPFAWAEPDAARVPLATAGWRGIAFEPVEAEVAFGTGTDPDPVARAVAYFLRIGPLAGRLRGAPEAERRAVARLLADALSGWLRGGAVRLPAAGWIVTARA
jgi:SAM-dependent methyltransferase